MVYPFRHLGPNSVAREVKVLLDEVQAHWQDLFLWHHCLFRLRSFENGLVVDFPEFGFNSSSEMGKNISLSFPPQLPFFTHIG